MATLVHLEEDGVDGKANWIDHVRKAVWGILYTEDAGFVPKSISAALPTKITISARLLNDDWRRCCMNAWHGHSATSTTPNSEQHTTTTFYGPMVSVVANAPAIFCGRPRHSK